MNNNNEFIGKILALIAIGSFLFCFFGGIEIGPIGGVTMWGLFILGGIIASRSNHTSNSKKSEDSEIKQKENKHLQYLNSRKSKVIGYKPTKTYRDNELRYFPLVYMPSNLIVELPMPGKVGRKGHMEDFFKKYLIDYFHEPISVHDNLVLKINEKIAFEPDFVLIDNSKDINLYIDIEIDEPYDGKDRQPIHYFGNDTNRNEVFTNHGWVVIRFAEIQIVENPISCCKYIAEIIASLNENYKINPNLFKVIDIPLIERWYMSQSIDFSIERYRERYLKINDFGVDPSEVILEQKFNKRMLLKEIQEAINSNKKI